jgi:hypothetical protein
MARKDVNPGNPRRDPKGLWHPKGERSFAEYDQQDDESIAELTEQARRVAAGESLEDVRKSKES